jgi:PAS domain S-box-containing protein
MDVSPKPTLRLPWLAAATGVYFLAGKLGLAMAFLHGSASPVWLCSGLAVAALLLFGNWLWPAIAAGSFLLNFAATAHPASSLIIAAGNTAEAVIAVRLVHRFAGGVAAFDRPMSICRYLACAAAACAVSATAGVLSLALAELAPWSRFDRIWVTWWTGDFMSMASFAPFLILWGRSRPLRLPAPRLLEAALMVVSVLAAGWALFGREIESMPYGVPTEFLELPPLLWAALRFGQKGAISAVQLLCAVAVWGTLAGRGPFHAGDANASLLQLQFFIGILSLTMLLLASVLSMQRGAERGLQLSEERFRQIAENIREVFYVNEPRGNGIVYVSPALEQVWGLQPQALIADNGLLRRSIHPDDLPRLEAAMERQRRGEETVTEYRIMRPDGGERRIIDRAFPLMDAQGRVARITGVATDVTERRRAEEKLRSVEDQLRHAQKMEAVGRLAGGIAHDFNNLLTAVNGYAELLMGRLGADDPNRAFAAEILKAGERGAGVTQQLLSFSRKQLTSPVVLDVNGVLQNMQKMLGRLLGAETRLDFSLGLDLPQTKADPGMVSQAVMNLVINAKDAMPEGGRVRVETFEAELSGEESDFYLRPEPGTYVGILVRDEGKGMDDTVKLHLFEPYFTTKEKGKGTGLGLCTVYGIVEQMRGGIRVQSSEDHGTSFYLYLRRAETEGAPMERRLGNQADPRPPRKATVLVVEDEENVRKLVKLTLISRGYRVLEASGEREAMRMHARFRGPIDLLLSDVVLPGKSGREIAKAFSELRPGMKVMFMSGYSEDPLLTQTMEKTGAVFLGKPFTPTQLVTKVQEAIEKKADVPDGEPAQSWTPT